MDDAEWDTITAQTWSLHLPEILQHLSTCSFVALDFEFSGIAAHRTFSARHVAPLQERYADIKEAAAKFQILQVGLTIAHEDPVSGTYTLKPYNVHLSPLVDPILGIDRIFSISSGAIQFLLKSGFRMDTPFVDGVRYLTQKEEELALKEACRHDNQSRSETVVQMELSKKENTESLAFLAVIRKEIDEWVARGEGAADYLNVPSRQSKSHKSKATVTSLNRFQKRLVHQLVEKEYPLLTTFGRTDFVTITRYDKRREENILQQKIQRVEKRLVDHRGFRWIIEALTGGDLSQLEAKLFDSVVLDCGKLSRGTAIKNFAESVKSGLQKNRPPVVGHNLFTDVVYMWQCFFGELPDRVEDFAKLVHDKFPLLIDTKYMFTHDCGDVNPVASLASMDEALKGITDPEIVIDAKHTRYRRAQHLHEAGYDSLLTARNFIKQASQLPEARRMPAAEPPEISETKPAHDLIVDVVDKALTRPAANSKDLSFAELQSKFAHQNLFDTLIEGTDGPEELIDEPNDDDREMATLIPSFSSPVWKVYGNKLRVFGTSERVCALDGGS
ncbi:Protein translocase subunit SecA [Talaromyces islandicus]|uniref:Protein translocase subunit SecA n=1 Tax=Talaromyces islandicus TaxID=28573 RepID=A0A0U1LM98_TALIS|nr:Protein translocase subunit SecA [Talaromyces islandicus]